MVIGINIAVMISIMIIGKRSKQLGWKHLLALCFLTILQTLVVAYSMFHMEKPPLF
jgi:dipeptide/tripeptide permease